MNDDQVQLLRALGSGVRRFDVTPDGAPAHDEEFSSLLGQSVRGRPHTPLGVSFAPALSGVYGLEDQRLIAAGVDRAAASGIERALILHERHTLRVDVRNRVVLDARKADHEDPLTGIDGFVGVRFAQESDEGLVQGPTSGGFPAPARVVRNASLVHALAGRASPI